MKTLVRMSGLVAVVLVTSALGPALFAGCSKGSSAPASEGIAWIHNLDDGLTKAAEEGKPVMVDFYTDWCGWCKKLDEDTYSNARVKAKAAQFVAVKVDAEQDEVSALKYGVQGFPTIVFTDAKGKEIHRVTGFAPPKAFVKEMDKALRKAK
jgi:thiol:disulfide interchange protein